MPRMKFVNMLPAAPGLRAMPAVVLPAVRPWPMPQPRPARPTAMPAPSAGPSEFDAACASCAKAVPGNTAATRVHRATWMNFFMTSLLLASRARWPLVGFLERQVDVDHREQRKHEGLQHAHHDAEAEEDRGH